MELADVIAAIEDHRFSAEVNLAAGTTAFRRGLHSHHLVIYLIELAGKPEVRAEVAKRIGDLSAREIDPRYENVYDAALSAYLTVLSETAGPDVIAETAKVACTARNCWWTEGLAKELLTSATASVRTSSSVGAKLAHEEVTILRLGLTRATSSRIGDPFGPWVAALKSNSDLGASTFFALPKSNPANGTLAAIPAGSVVSRQEQAVGAATTAQKIEPFDSMIARANRRNRPRFGTGPRTRAVRTSPKKETAVKNG